MKPDLKDKQPEKSKFEQFFELMGQAGVGLIQAAFGLCLLVVGIIVIVSLFH